MLGLGNKLGKTSLVTPGIITDNLVLKHKYDSGAVVPVSDGAAFFDASQSNEIPTGLPGSTFDGDFTVSCWAFVIPTAADKVILGSHDGTDLMFCYVSAAEKMYMKFTTSGGGDDYTHGATILTEGWNYLTFIQDDTNNRQYTYLNGVDDTDSGGTHDAAITLTSTETTIGASNDVTLEFNGYLCNLGVWTSVLTPAQIKSIMWKNYAGLSSSEKTNLVSWWNLDSSFSGSVTNDELLVYDNHYNAGTDILGDNVLLDGTFTEDVGESASGTYWTTGAGWTISGGSATYDGGGDSNTQLDSAVNSNIVDGNVYQIKFDLTDTGGGGVYVRLNNTWWSEGGSDIITGTATHTIYARAGTGTNFIEFETGHDDKAFSLDNITIRKVNGNPGVLL